MAITINTEIETTATPCTDLLLKVSATGGTAPYKLFVGGVETHTGWNGAETMVNVIRGQSYGIKVTDNDETIPVVINVISQSITACKSTRTVEVVVPTGESRYVFISSVGDHTNVVGYEVLPVVSETIYENKTYTLEIEAENVIPTNFTSSITLVVRESFGGAVLGQNTLNRDHNNTVC